MTGLGLVAAAAVLWGTWVLFLRPAGLEGPQSALVALAVMALPAPFVFRRKAFADRGAVAALAVLGVADAANAALFFGALQRGPVAVAVLTHYLAPLLVVLVAPWVAREPRSLRALAAAPVVLAGLSLVLGLTSTAPWPLETAAMGAGSAVFYAALVFGFKRAGRSFSPLAITALHAPVSVAVLLAVFGRAALPQGFSPGVAWVAVGAVVCGLGATSLFNLGLTRVTTQAAGALTYLEPLTATAVGIVAFGERLSAAGVAGAVVVLGAGAYVAIQRVPEPTP